MRGYCVVGQVRVEDWKAHVAVRKNSTGKERVSLESRRLVLSKSQSTVDETHGAESEREEGSGVNRTARIGGKRGEARIGILLLFRVDYSVFKITNE